MNKTWDELRAVEAGTILLDKFNDGVRFIIMRGPASLCAYVGVPSDHPLAGFDYDDLCIDCHGGLTFAASGDTENSWPPGFYWYGWDYSHAGDRSFYSDDLNLHPIGDERRWLVEDVEKGSWSAIYDFRRQMKLAEKIAAKATA